MKENVYLVLGSSRFVGMQFTLPLEAVPIFVKKLPFETPEQFNDRMEKRLPGKSIAGPFKNASVAEFPGQVEAAGYQMISAVYEKRPVLQDPTGQKIRHMVRFTFCRDEFVNISDEFKKIRDTLRLELMGICDSAVWQIQAYTNLIYQTDGYSMIVKINNRKPYSNGTGILMSIEPAYTLCARDAKLVQMADSEA